LYQLTPAMGSEIISRRAVAPAQPGSPAFFKITPRQTKIACIAI
jgi:hypothetical protein